MVWLSWGLYGVLPITVQLRAGHDIALASTFPFATHNPQPCNCTASTLLAFCQTRLRGNTLFL
jgi:hypothetical protein